MNKIGGKPRFELEPSWQPVIAVNEGVVECGGGPVYMWVAADMHTSSSSGFGA